MGLYRAFFLMMIEWNLIMHNCRFQPKDRYERNCILSAVRNGNSDMEGVRRKCKSLWIKNEQLKVYLVISLSDYQGFHYLLYDCIVLIALFRDNEV